MYLIFGGGGYLGTYLIQEVIGKTDETVLATIRGDPPWAGGRRVVWERCDITDTESVERICRIVKGQRLKVIVCAAYHHPDQVEEHPRLAWHTNVTALSDLLNRLEQVDRLVYPSTDSVYGESKGGHHFREDDIASPVNVYGRQKAAAEQLVIGYGYHVVRFPFLIGPSLVPGRPHFYDRIVEELQAGGTVEMFGDSCRSALDFRSAAAYTIDLMESPGKVPRIVNICGDEDLSKYEIGLRIARKYGIPEERVIPISVRGEQNYFSAARAASTLMDNSRLKGILGLDRIRLRL